jgi:enterochelin esterase-like enzyme
MGHQFLKLMRSMALFIGLIITSFWHLDSALAGVDHGRLVKWEAMTSSHVGPRTIRILLPEGYDQSNQSYPVIYMHDGQNLFDPELGYGGKEWGVDEVLHEGIKSKTLRPAIIVGIDNTALRGSEYLPNKVFDRLSPRLQAIILQRWKTPPVSDSYLKFIVSELKPAIDKSFRTLKDKDNSFIMGSSMGGLISLYAQTEYPEVFGASASLSTHWPATHPEPVKAYKKDIMKAWEDYLKSVNFNPDRSRVYTDQGTEFLDSFYTPYARQFEAILKKRGFVDTVSFSSQVFPKTTHNEDAWRKRLITPLRFLLEKKVVAAGSLIIEKDMTSKSAGTHTVWIWLPPGYDPDTKARYSVLYMTDGQNLFDPSPYSGSSWGIAETLPDLIKKRIIPPMIVVGIESRDNRTCEYMPQWLYENAPKPYQDRIKAFAGGPATSDAYIGFIADELKTLIDKNYKTKPEREHTMIMGSSMGGHLALYAHGQRPDIFGASASLSMPWLMAMPLEGVDDRAIVQSLWADWLKTTKLNPRNDLIYTDQGTEMIDAVFTPYSEAITPIFNETFLPNRFSHITYDGTGHNEVYWRARLDKPLIFMTKNRD